MANNRRAKEDAHSHLHYIKGLISVLLNQWTAEGRLTVDFCYHCGIDVNTFFRWKSGRQVPSADRLLDILYTCGFSTDLMKLKKEE